jgi:hypothetical protein
MYAIIETMYVLTNQFTPIFLNGSYVVAPSASVPPRSNQDILLLGPIMIYPE